MLSAAVQGMRGCWGGLVAPQEVDSPGKGLLLAAEGMEQAENMVAMTFP